MKTQEHIDWCKQRASQLAKANNPRGALERFIGDMKKHDETQNHISVRSAVILLLLPGVTATQVSEFLNGVYQQ